MSGRGGDERSFLAIGRESEFREGKGRHVFVRGRGVAVFRSGGKFFACRDRCPHMGAELSLGTLRGRTVTCSWHEWSFDLQDGHCLNKEGRGVAVYEVRVRDGMVEIALPEAEAEPPAAPPEDDRRAGR